MKIMFFVSSMNTGGAERVAANLVNEWSSHENEVSLVVTHINSSESNYEISPKVKVIYIRDLISESCLSFLKKNRLGMHLYKIHKLRKLILNQKPDVIVSSLTNVNIIMLLATIGMNLKIFVCEHTYPPSLPNSKISDILRWVLYPLATKVVMLTSEGNEWLKKTIPKAMGAVIPNPIVYPLPVTSPIVSPMEFYNKIENKKIILSVGRLIELKQVSLLIESFSFLSERYPDWLVFIIGSGPEEDNIRNKINELNLSEKVIMVGRVGNLSNWYEIADMYVMTSRVEGFPSTLAEAMSYGCPSICFDINTGPRDLIINNENGILLNPDFSPLSLANAIEQLILDDVMRLKLKKNSPCVLNDYSMDVIIDKWGKLIFSKDL